jgi:prevent-host-death family protein
MTIIVGARELKNRLGSYLRLAREGTRVVVTERGRPIAELRALEPASDLDVRLRRLATEGLISLPMVDQLPPRHRITMAGPPLSSTILEDRDDRL